MRIGRKRETSSLTSVGKWIRNFIVGWALIFAVLYVGVLVIPGPRGIGVVFALLVGPPLLSLIAVFFLWEVSRG